MAKARAPNGIEIDEDECRPLQAAIHHAGARRDAALAALEAQVTERAA